jgi:uncharacterized protein
MAAHKTWWFDRRRAALALTLVASAVAMPAPAGAQFFDDRYPYDQPSRRQQPQSRSFFSMPWDGDRPRRPAPANPYGSFIRPPQQVESIKPPPPRKQDTPPTSTVMVIGDSLAEWLAYGLEETYATDAPDIGVERNIHPTSGLVRYDPRNDTLDWSQAVKDALATEKPSAIVIMLGLNDRLPLRENVPVRPSPPHAGDQPAPAAAAAGTATPAPGTTPPASEPSPQQSEQQPSAASNAPRPGTAYDFHTDQWADLYGKRIDDMIAAVKSKGVPLVWVGLPALRGVRSTSDMSYFDEIFRARAEKAGIVYVDIWDGFVDDQGRYAVQGPDFEGQTRRLRTYDGVNFTRAGALKLAHYVERELSRVLSNHITPVALPMPDDSAAAKPSAVGGPKPVIGPVLPLTAAADGGSGDLIGAGGHSAPVARDPVAASVLNRGDALAAPTGRADDFSWPRRGTDTVDTAPEPVALTPPATPARTPDVKKADDAKAKAKSTPDVAAVRPRPAPRTDLDGGAPRPPAPVGR